MIQSPVRSGLFSFLGKTETRPVLISSASVLVFPHGYGKPAGYAGTGHMGTGMGMGMRTRA